MARKKRLNLVISFIRIALDLSSKKVSNFASSTAFFFFISLIPFCILLSTLLPLTRIDEAAFIDLVVANTPEIVDGIVRSIIEDAFASGGKVFSFSLLGIIYASGKGMVALMQGLNIVYAIPEHRSYPRIAFVSVIYMTLLMVFIIVSVLLGLFGEMIYDFISAHFPHLEGTMAGVLGLRFPVIVIYSVLLFLLMYTYVPAKKQIFTRQLPGAIFSTVGWIIFSKIFTVVMSHGTIYNTYYGSLAAIVIFMLWMYGCFYIILVGGYINAVYAKNGKIDRQGRT